MSTTASDSLSQEKRRKQLAYVKQSEERLKQREKQAACYILDIQEGNKNPFSEKYCELTTRRPESSRVAPDQACEFIDELMEISGFCHAVSNHHSRNSLIVFTDKIRGLPINNLDAIQERCIHCRIVENLLKNKTYSNFWQILDIDGNVGDFSDNVNNPYLLFRKLDSQNRLSIAAIRNSLEAINEFKVITDVDNYIAAVKSCNSTNQQDVSPGGSSTTSREGHSPQASSVTTVSGHHVVNITVQGSATFQAPIADNRPTSLHHRQPEDHTDSSSKSAKLRSFSFPEQETDD